MTARPSCGAFAAVADFKLITRKVREEAAQGPADRETVASAGRQAPVSPA